MDNDLTLKPGDNLHVKAAATIIKAESEGRAITFRQALQEIADHNNIGWPSTFEQISRQVETADKQSTKVPRHNLFWENPMPVTGGITTAISILCVIVIAFLVGSGLSQ